MSDAAVAVTSTLVLNRAKEQVKPDMTLADRAKLCFRLVCDDDNSYMCYGDDQRFHAGIVALFALATDEEKRALEHELQLLKSFNAAASGVPVDFNALLSDDGPTPIGLNGLFREAQAKGRL